jgi:sigma-B regulation protein RsbU (phosphoserine phosphatase)
MNATPLRLLLIEDNPGDARLLEEMLRDARSSNFQIAWETRLDNGLARLRQGDIDAAIVDLNLPDAAGIDTVIRTRAAAPDLPIVVLTSSASDEKAMQALRAGAQDYLVKGWADSELLARTIRYAIERQRTERELARYTRELRARNDQMRSDLQLAHEVQMALLPHDYPVLPAGATPDISAISFHHHYQSASYLAGDFFDIFPITRTAAGVFLCDVMGHGVRAALVTAMVRPLVDEFAGRGGPPGDLLSAINTELCRIFKQAGTTIYATASYLIPDVATGKLLYANAGHPAPLHVRQQSDDVQPLIVAGKDGPALGLFDDTKFESRAISLAPGDGILMFTDGLFEVQNPAGEEYGLDRLHDFVYRQRRQPMADLIPLLIDDVQQFTVHKVFTDDVCILGMQLRHIIQQSQ